MEIQVMISQWISQVADFLPVGYAFGAGMVSAVNPCGFFMLPVYMTLYLGAEDEDFLEHTLLNRIMKATWVAAMVTIGFGLLFGTVGALVAVGGYFLMAAIPWFAVAVGVVLLMLGIWMIMGKTIELPLAFKIVHKVGDLRHMSNRGYFVFGLAFGATSLGCTMPIFLAVIGSSITASNFMTGFLQFISYVLGMGLIMHSLTLGIALVKKRIVLGAMRRVVPYIHKISALFLFTAGSYIIYYWLSSGLLFTD